MDYNFRKIEDEWQKKWKDNSTYKVDENTDKLKYYVLDMFPYPSGAGLHVGHPLGYIASDVFARYKRLKGYNVLHPMGYDAFGLPAEQYAIQTGQHPAVTTEENINTYRRQLDQLGFSYDWSRQVRTCDPDYYKWTQWIFLKLFDAWYNKDTDKAEPISSLRAKFAEGGSDAVNAHGDEHEPFTADQWEGMTKAERNMLLLNYRLAYLSEAMVNWCPALGTVLANDEVKDGVSERGGHPVEQKLMKQWSMRITAYAQRLLDGLESIDWSESMKEIQRNWIGRSEGAMVRFKVAEAEGAEVSVFTTRPDTIFGVSFMVLAPEHELVDGITTPGQKEAIEAYKKAAAKKSERDRMSDVKTVSGEFTGAYALHPFSGEKIPIWIGDYVLATYGTGAVMAVPSGDQRDWNFARHFDLPIPPVIEGTNIEEGANDSKDGTMINSDFLNGMQVPEAIKTAIEKIEEKDIGKGTINYRLRDAVFGRQRYWGEPIPIYYKDGVPYPVAEEDLPLVLPEVDKFLPTEDGEPPLARAEDWNYNGNPIETTTMPGWAGSSWYYLRYMDAKNPNEFAAKDKIDYWQNVDLYIGGAEHATGHLLYVRFWTKALNDLGYLPFDEPVKKLINQGMIQGVSQKIYRVIPESGTDNVRKYFSFKERELHSAAPQEIFVSADIATDCYSKSELQLVHIPISNVENQKLNISALMQLDIDYLATADNIYFMCKYGHWVTHINSSNIEFARFPDVDESEVLDKNFYSIPEVEKMSKRWGNVVNPDDLVEKYGADTLRLYEMFLGPLTESKPWDVKGIEGTHRFLKKLWRLFYHNNEWAAEDTEPTKDELKVLHRTIKKVQEDLERFSFNTVVSEFMICVNDLTDFKCNNKTILEQLVVLVSPYAPHIAEELWLQLGNTESVTSATFPEFDEQYLVEDSFEYPVSFNGKTRFRIELPTTLTKEEVEKEVLAHADAQKWLDGKPPKKVIVVPKRIVNVVI